MSKKLRLYLPVILVFLCASTYADTFKVPLNGLKVEVRRDGDTYYSLILESSTPPFSSAFNVEQLSGGNWNANTTQRLKLIPPSEHVQLWLAMVLNSMSQEKKLFVEGQIHEILLPSGTIIRQLVAERLATE